MSRPLPGELSLLGRCLGLLLACVGACCLLPPAAGAAVLADEDGDVVTTPHFEWDFGNQGGAVERVEGLKWRRDAAAPFGPNLAAAAGGACGDATEFWGQSYGNADGQGPGPVVAGNRGAWTPRGGRSVEISTVAPEACSGDTPPIPVRTRYSFFDEGAAANTVRVERRWSFALTQEPYAVQGMRAYVPRLPTSPYDQEIYPKDDGSLATAGLCNVCIVAGSGADWNQTWVAINASSTNAGLLILRDPANASPASVTLDYDGASGSNNTGISLDRPLPNGWLAPLTETEYLCFYDATSWPPAERSATRLPDGCAVASPPINTEPPALSAGAGAPRAGERFFAAPGTWDNATGAFAYQWSRCLEDVCQAIAGATGTEYVAGAADVGRSLKVRVTATAPGGETDAAESNVAGSVSGHVYVGSKDPANLVAFAPVQVCRRSGAPCRSTTTDANGLYRVQAPLVGKYRVTAFPPAGLDAVSRTRPTITRVKAERETSGEDVVLGAVKPPPPQVDFSGAGVRDKGAAGVPVVHWQEPFVISYEAPIGNEVEARVEFASGQVLRLLPQQPVEAKPGAPGTGIFKFAIQPLIPNHGAARVSILSRAPRTQAQIEAAEAAEAEEEAEEEEEEAEEEDEEEENEEEDEEPEEEEETPEEEDEEEDQEDEEEEDEEQEEDEEEDGEDEEEGPVFPIYIDPSGYVRAVNGAPLGGAKVTLFQATAKSGPFTVVPNGSAVMSPMNRVNPDFSETDGHFGWDVIAGFYKVTVAAPGCHAPGNAAQPLVETAVMTIPPPVTDLDLRLECEGDPPPPPEPPRPPVAQPRPPAARASLRLPASATVKVGKEGRFKVAAGTIECPAGASPCAVEVAVSAAAPKPKGGKKAHASAKGKLLPLGTARLSVAAGKASGLEGKLSAAGLAKLKKAKRLKATIAVRVTQPGAEGAAGSLGATLQAPPAKPKPRRR